MFLAIVKSKDPDIHTVNDTLVERVSKNNAVLEYKDLFSIGTDLPNSYLSRFSSGQSGSSLWPVAAFLEQQGVAPVNSLRSLIVSANKHLTQVLFEKNEIPQPDWALFIPGTRIEFFGNAWKGKTIAKPNIGGGGRNVSVFDSLKKAQEHVQDIQEPMILQPYIEHTALWRIILSARQGIISSYQKKTDSEIKSLSKDATRFYADAPPELKSLAEKMTIATGLGISGLDVLETENGFLALESNANFDFSEKEERVFVALEKEMKMAATRYSRFEGSA